MADNVTYAIADDLSGVVATEDGFGKFPTKLDASRRWLELLLGEREEVNAKIGTARSMIERLAKELPEPNYWVSINMHPKKRADTVEECWEIIGKAPFGSLYSVESPKDHDVSEFIPF